MTNSSSSSSSIQGHANRQLGRGARPCLDAGRDDPAKEPANKQLGRGARPCLNAGRDDPAKECGEPPCLDVGPFSAKTGGRQLVEPLSSRVADRPLKHRRWRCDALAGPYHCRLLSPARSESTPHSEGHDSLFDELTAATPPLLSPAGNESTPDSEGHDSLFDELTAATPPESLPAGGESELTGHAEDKI